MDTLKSGQQGGRIDKSVRSTDALCQPPVVGYSKVQTYELQDVEESHHGTSGVLDLLSLLIII